MGYISMTVSDPTANVTLIANTTIADADLTTVYNWTKYASGNNALTANAAMQWWSAAMLNWSLQQIQAWQLQTQIAAVSVNTISTNTSLS